MPPPAQPATSAQPTLIPSVFAHRSASPSAEELASVLGPACSLWDKLVSDLALVLAPATTAWAYAGKRWSLCLKRRDRAIVYLTPLEARFRASLAIPERAMSAALEADLPEQIRSVVASAPLYVEGRAVRLEVSSASDLDAVLTLARVRMAS